PAPHRVVDARLESPRLLLVAHREPVLDEVDAVGDQEPLEDRALLEEPAVLLRRTKAEHRLDPRAVVPAAVEQDDLTGCGELFDVALEVPLRLLALGGDGERNDARDARVQELGDPLDRPAL